MAIVLWDGSLNTGYNAIDAQHKHLFEVINNLHNKIVRGDDKVFLLTTLDSLKQYVRFHFRTEEELMHTHAYPSREEHLEDHRRFEQKVLEIESKSDEEVSKLLMEILSFLLGWLILHIQQEDLRLTSHLKDVGA